MKLPFDYPKQGYHQYCLNCFDEAVSVVHKNKKTYYHCSSCGQTNERSLVIDPKITSWLDDDREYWHESAGVFIKNPAKEVLFFQRTTYPFSLTVPAGHVDVGEKPARAAQREVQEEVGLVIDAKQLHHVATNNLTNDPCRRGADSHVWHAYVVQLPEHTNISVQEEGEDAVWLMPDEALKRDLTSPVRYHLERYAHELAG